ncbi:MAG TPA: DNA mismatch repair endonuclease MutL, partial [bacterium]|nr:DNA mismatch repair endonuclease MutL [bacterium]
MGVIRQLPDDVINRIAAGEVIERPASVLKELLENALDTDTPAIEVELDGGGAALIVVRDRGQGMDRNDLLMALERHATSKLSAGADLVAIPTLGFRGEALPSIAAVTDLRLRSRARGAVGGFEAQITAGVIRNVVETGMPEGTEVRAARLFHNLPARRKFLRSAETEKGHCLTV